MKNEQKSLKKEIGIIVEGESDKKLIFEIWYLHCRETSICRYILYQNDLNRFGALDQEFHLQNLKAITLIFMLSILLYKSDFLGK